MIRPLLGSLLHAQRATFTHAGLLAGAVVLWCLPFVWQGLDITDTGFHLTQQAYFFDGGRHGWPINLPVDGLASLLTMPLSGLGLLGARLSWAALTATTAVVAFFVLRRTGLASDPWMAATVFCAAVVASSPVLHLVHYYNLPALVALAVVARSIWLPGADAPGSRYRRLGEAFLLGAAVVITTLLRPPNALIVLVPLLAIGMDAFKGRKHAAEALQMALAGVAGMAFSFGATILVAHLTGALPPYMDALAEITRTRMENNKVWSRQLVVLASTTGVLAGGALASALLLGLSRVRGMGIVKGLSPLPLLACLMIMWWKGQQTWVVATALPLLALAAVLGTATLAWLRDRTQTRTILLVVGSVVLMIASCLGSSGGMKKILHGVWLALPLTALAPLFIVKILPFGTRWREFSHQVLTWIVAPAYLFLGLLGAHDQITSVYRDSTDRTLLVHSIPHPRLMGILTTEARARSIDQVLAEIESRSSPNDELLIYNSAPLLYYLSNRKPIVSQNWLVIANITEEKIKYLFKNICTKEGKWPKIIVRSKTDTRNVNWGGEKNFPVKSEKLNKALQWVDTEVSRCHPKTVWENGDFAIFETEHPIQ
jgi:hypothetical protein